MSKHVVAGRTSVGDKDGAAAVKITVDELAKGSELVFQSAGLDEHIQIPFRDQIKQRDCMD